jgi:O-antigen ligase
MTVKILPAKLLAHVPWVLAMPLSLLIISIALIPSAHKWTLPLVFFSLTLLFLCRGWDAFFLLSSIYVVIFLETTIGLRLSETRGFSFLNIVLFTSLLLVLIKNLKEQQRLFLENPLNRPLFLLVLWTFLSMASAYFLGLYPASNFWGLLLDFKNYFNFLLIFFIAFNLPRTRPEVRTLIWILAGFFILSIVLNMLTYYGLVRFITFKSVKLADLNSIYAGAYETGWRLRGLLREPNVFASFLVLFMPMLMVAAAYVEKRLLRWVFLLSLFYSLVVLILTGSRGGYVGTLLSFALLLFLLGRTGWLDVRRSLVLLLAVVVLMSALLFFYFDPFWTNTVRRFVPRRGADLDALTHWRFTAWSQGIGEFLKRPLLGTGLSSLVLPHNNFIYYLVHFGLFGFALYAFIYFQMGRSALHHVTGRELTFSNFLNISFLAGLGGVLATMFFVEIFKVHDFIFLWAGLVFRYNLLEPGPGQD